MFFYLFLILFLLMLGLVARAIYIKNKIRRRLQFGVTPQEETSEANLLAGSYGLSGTSLIFYYLTQFLNSKYGALVVLIVGGIVGILLRNITNISQNIYFVAFFSGITVWLVTMMLLKIRQRARLTKIRFELPNALEMTAAIMESGLGFESALGYVLREADMRHPLYFDLAIMNEAMQRGRRRHEALKLWALRANEPNISEVTSSMIQADQTGASLGAVLKHHAISLQKENESFMMRQAERLPVKMLLPMVLLILPPIFIVAAGPSIIRIFQIFKEIMGRA